MERFILNYHYKGETGLSRFSLHTYGCQMNVYDGDRLRTALTESGWTETDERTADCVIFLTCSIRDKAEQKVMSTLGRFAASWGEKKRPYVAILGCMAQRTGVDLVKRFPWVRLLAGPRHLGWVPEALEGILNDGEVRLFLDENPYDLEDLSTIPLIRHNPWKAFVTIAYGCDHFCSYCIVPYVRGRFKSRDPHQILDEIRLLAASGVVEVTLLGQNVNRYGKDLSPTYPFSRLLREAAETEGIKIVRFATSHPLDFDEDIISAMAENSRIAPSVNLPIQSGSDRVLKMMRRGYCVDDFKRIVSKIREKLPEVGLTTDVIVGFPGETQEDFVKSMTLLEELQFDLVHTASYSPRPGTKAAEMKDQVPIHLKMERLNQMNALQSKISSEINKNLLGKEYVILVEDRAPKGEDLFMGRTPSDKVVLFQGSEKLLGHFLRVRITSTEAWSLKAQPLT